MRALVVYESMFGNTKAVAYAVAKGVEKWVPVDVAEVSSAPTVLNEEISLLIVGGPTHAFGMSRESTRRDAATKGTKVIVLDAETAPAIDGTAAHMLAELARSLERDGVQILVRRAADAQRKPDGHAGWDLYLWVDGLDFHRVQASLTLAGDILRPLAPMGSSMAELEARDPEEGTAEWLRASDQGRDTADGGHDQDQAGGPGEAARAPACESFANRVHYADVGARSEHWCAARHLGDPGPDPACRARPPTESVLQAVAPDLANERGCRMVARSPSARRPAPPSGPSSPTAGPSIPSATCAGCASART